MSHFQSVIIKTNIEDVNGEYISTILNEKVESTSNLFLIYRQEKKSTIGITEVTKLTNWAYGKSSDKKYGVISEGHLLTTEAQNSLLKIIEEPPVFTQIVVVTKNLESILDTIISRCNIIYHDTDDINSDEIQEIIKMILGKNFVEREKYLSNTIENKDNEREFINRVIEELIIILKNSDLKSHSEENHHMIELLIKLIRDNNQNVNKKLIIEGINLVVEEFDDRKTYL